MASIERIERPDGVVEWHYPAGNEEALRAVQQAAREQSDRINIFVPSEGIPGDDPD